jgi:hypothetical protein
MLHPPLKTCCRLLITSKFLASELTFNGWKSLGIGWILWKELGHEKWYLEVGWEGVDLLHMAQDSDQWRALVNTMKNLRFPQKMGNFLTS